MINALKKGEWNVAKSCDPKTTALKQIRRGRPTLIHDSSRMGTFRGNLKETFKFGPAFPNTDRKVKLGNKVPTAKAAQVIEKKQVEKVKRVKRWGWLRRFFNRIFKKGGKR